MLNRIRYHFKTFKQRKEDILAKIQSDLLTNHRSVKETSLVKSMVLQGSPQSVCGGYLSWHWEGCVLVRVSHPIQRTQPTCEAGTSGDHTPWE
jgi:hypothetical protein